MQSKLRDSKNSPANICLSTTSYLHEKLKQLVEKNVTGRFPVCCEVHPLLWGREGEFFPYLKSTEEKLEENHV